MFGAVYMCGCEAVGGGGGCIMHVFDGGGVLRPACKSLWCGSSGLMPCLHTARYQSHTGPGVGVTP